jgi:hypothetical protein
MHRAAAVGAVGAVLIDADPQFDIGELDASLKHGSTMLRPLRASCPGFLAKVVVSVWLMITPGRDTAGARRRGAAAP